MTDRRRNGLILLLVAGLLAVQLWAAFHGRLEPIGKVYRDAAGNAWVVIRGVHPKFVAAVEAARVPATNPQIT